MDTALRSIGPDGRSEIVIRLKDYLASRPEVLFAYLHGSFADGRPFRDIDLAVWVEPSRATLDHELELGVELQRLVPIRVDVRLLNTAPLALRYHATRGRWLVSKDDDLRSESVERWRLAYWDYLPVARRHLAEVLHG